MNRRKSFDDLQLILPTKRHEFSKKDNRIHILIVLTAAILLAYCNLYNLAISFEMFGSSFMLIYFTLMYSISLVNIKLPSLDIASITTILNLLSCIGNDYDILNNNSYIISYTCQLIFIFYKIQNKMNFIFSLLSFIGFIAYHMFKKYHFIFIAICSHFFQQ